MSKPISDHQVGKAAEELVAKRLYEEYVRTSEYHEGSWEVLPECDGRGMVSAPADHPEWGPTSCPGCARCRQNNKGGADA